MDWTKEAVTPVDRGLHKKILHHLRSMRLQVDTELFEFIREKVRGKRVLDIGACDHDLAHIESENWRHRMLCGSAAHCVGVDIIKHLIDALNAKGFNLKCVDATSDSFIGELFDVVFIGDVIEHVNDPVRLMKFAKRHLKENGIIMVGTPNPFFYKYFIQTLREGTFISNLEHCFWITPCMMLEICRRSSLALDKYVFFVKSRINLKREIKKLLPLEIFHEHYWYLIKNTSSV